VPTGRAVFERIVWFGKITVVQLMRGSGVTQEAVSRNLKALKRAQLDAERKGPHARQVFNALPPRHPQYPFSRSRAEESDP
jgi:hypothetical protein